MRATMLFGCLCAVWTVLAERAGAEPCFGFYELRDGVPFAVSGGVWTFDQGADPNEGWSPAHVYDPPGPDIVRWQTIDDFADDGLPPGAPIIGGTGMIWAGRHEAEAQALCYECGLGYGFGMQRMRSPWIPYTGGDVDFEFLYFQDMNGAGMEVVVDTDVRSSAWTDLGIGDGTVGSWNDPETFSTTIDSGLKGASALRVQIYFVNQYGGGDEDCSFDSHWGAFGVDDLRFSGGADAFFDFEGSSQGWETLGGWSNEDPDFWFETRPLESYGEGYENWPGCRANGNVMTFHGPDIFPPVRFEGATSPIIDFAQVGSPQILGLSLSADLLEDYPGGDPNPGIWWYVYARYYPTECVPGGPPRWSNWSLVFFDEITDLRCDTVTAYWGGAGNLPELPERAQVHVAVKSCEGCCPVPCEGAAYTPFLDNLKVCVRLHPTDVPSEPGFADTPLVRLSSQPVTAGSTARLGDLRGSLLVDLFDAQGRRVTTLFEGSVESGEELPIGQWLSERAPKLSPGMYFARFRVGDATETVRAIWAP